ncbi:putative farnesol dehydrogenase (NAD(+)) [Rosa chinensis]|uniref:Putative farnesol dehydrogenase (NAD(+)) n=1 Tax=Rosa chinensis TaxID=74649 RepID=A0A2P6Q5A9_ROSCH|nr:putative farnesol dehydrogenase (NAD(+)) [Rosa chinensis]
MNRFNSYEQNAMTGFEGMKMVDLVVCPGSRIWMLILISRITGKLSLISPPTVYVLRHQWAYLCEKAKQKLDYSPRSLT